MKYSLPLLLLMVLHKFTTAQQSPEVNYDEQKVQPYTLPDPLRTNENAVVTTSTAWETRRRPEILKMFEDNVYGQMPNDYDSVSYETVNHNTNALEGRAALHEVHINVFRNRQSVTIHLVLFVPKGGKKPAPAFLFINNRGRENTDPSRQTKSAFWPVELVVDSGYAMAAFHVQDLAPDNKDSFATGVMRLYPEQRNATNGMRAIGAWAWGASRVMDYLQTNKDIDASRVAVAGHSRGGKAALWAAAQDKRFAMCVSNCSGNTGVALSKRNFGETVAIINTAFPHWFTPNYKKYNDNEAALPIDQHLLVATIAPRLFYATNATKDLWADPTGTYLSLKHAEKVYALYGLKSQLPATPPGINMPVVEGPLAYHNRQGVHDLTEYDWKHFVVFANHWFGYR